MDLRKVGYKIRDVKDGVIRRGRILAARRRFKRKKLNKRAIFVTAVFLAAAAFLSVRLVKVSSSIFRTEEENAITRYINESIRETAAENRDMIISSFRDGGSLSGVASESAALNAVRSELSLKIAEKCEKNSRLSIRVPFGSLFGNWAFSGRGPGIPMKAFVSSSVKTDIRASLESGGINQTLYSVYMDIEVEYECGAPFLKEKGKVSTSALIYSSVIIGDVPRYYPYPSDRYS